MSNKLKGYDSFQGKIVGKITATGKSAYELWLDQGNVGSVQDFLGTLTDKNFVHKQTASENVWHIVHNLNKYPSVVVVDTADTVVYGDIQYISLNEIQITFTDPFSGEAYLN